MQTTSHRRRSTAGVALLLLGLVITLIPLSGWTVEADAQEVPAGSSGNPSNECNGLIYLDKFDFTTMTFDQGTTSEAGGVYTSSTGVVVSNVGDKSITWSSTTPIDRVWEKAGNDTNDGTTYDEETGPITETVVGNGYSHITFCYDEDAPTRVEPGVVTTDVCGSTNEPTGAVVTGVSYSVTADGDDWTVTATPVDGSYEIIVPSGWTGDASSASISVTGNDRSSEQCSPTRVEPGVVTTDVCGSTNEPTGAVVTGVSYSVTADGDDWTVTATPVDGSYEIIVPSGWTGDASSASISVTGNDRSSEQCSPTRVEPGVVTTDVCGSTNEPTGAVVTGVSYSVTADGDDWTVTATPVDGSYEIIVPSGWTGDASSASISVTGNDRSSEQCTEVLQNCITNPELFPAEQCNPTPDPDPADLTLVADPALCDANGSYVTWDLTILDPDDQLGDVTVTVTNPGGEEVVFTVDADTRRRVFLPGVFGETVTVVTSEGQSVPVTLLPVDDCADTEVEGEEIVNEPEPETEVLDEEVVNPQAEPEELAATGFGTEGAAIAGAVLMLGGLLMLIGDRRRGFSAG